MSDIQLYKRTGDFPYDEKLIEELDGVLLDSIKITNRRHVICNKVLKFFLTEKGSDLFNPEYGARSLPITQMDESYLPKFKLEFEEDIRRCLEYYKKSERKHKERLSRIRLKTLRMREDKTKTQAKVEIVIEIITNKNTRASIELN